MSDSPPPEYSVLPPGKPEDGQLAVHQQQEPSAFNQGGSSLGSRLLAAQSTLNLSSTDPSTTGRSHYGGSQGAIILSPDPCDVRPLAPPPTYTPTIYNIGARKLRQPLVTVADVKGHLALMHSFIELKKQVESALIERRYVPENTEKKWAWFVGLAVERFDTWCQALTIEAASKPTHVVMPPVDVIMVWHSYMLNPRCYGEDCVRNPACQALATFERHFKKLLEDPWLVLTDPAMERVDCWTSTTGLGYDPLTEMHKVTKKIISCPKCNGPIQVDLINEDGTGYFQRHFTAKCTGGNCRFSPITMETLAVRKLVQDLISETDHHKLSSYLAGTLFSRDPFDKQKGIDMKNSARKGADRYLKTHPSARNIHGDLEPYQLYRIVMRQCKYSMRHLKGLIGIPPIKFRLGNRIMNAYGHDKIYSVELVGAVHRQSSFVQKMYDLGWTASTFFEDPSDEVALQHAIARYHAFLDLISFSRSMVVPTLDIDLVWHTHQLFPEIYRSDCDTYVRQFVDHDDKVEGSNLSTAFEDTCRLWKERHHIQYSHCGCPVEGKSIGERLSRLVGMSSPTTATLEPINRPDILSSTHPSDHNAVRLVPKEGDRISSERTRIEDHSVKRQKEMIKAIKKAHDSKGKSILGLTRSSDNDRSGGRSLPSSICCTHDAAFLVPIPMYYGDTGIANRGDCLPEAHLVNMFGGAPRPGIEMSGCGVPGGLPLPVNVALHVD